uniref:Ig-like domain-containing protein n=1 Tax=Salmo trutta TaxID=8032 RepID=A0A674F495_SALTR
QISCPSECHSKISPLDDPECTGDHIQHQQGSVIATEGGLVTLSCQYNTTYSLLWYKQSPGSAPQNLLLILDSTGTEHRADSLDSRFSGKQNKEKTRLDLEISSVDVTDSALYYCALNPTTLQRPRTSDYWEKVINKQINEYVLNTKH